MSDKPHGPVDERFMRHHYGPSGYVEKQEAEKHICPACGSREIPKPNSLTQTIVIKSAGHEIGRVTAEKLEFSKRFVAGSPRTTEMENDPKLFTAKDASGKALFVVRVSEDKEITTERI